MAGPQLAISATTADVLRHSPLGEEALTPQEHARAAAFRRRSDREDFVAAHLLARLVAARVAAADARDLHLVQHCADCGGPHGRPAFQGRPDLTVSLSHAPGVVAAAAGRHPVGVDIERLDATPLPPEAMAHVLAPAEQRRLAEAGPAAQAVFLRTWVRKESLIKCGVTDLAGMHRIDVSDIPDGGRYDAKWHILDWWTTLPTCVAAASSTHPLHLVTLPHLLTRNRAAA
ncbi:4'-phosphopantetheinyl transferase superfamily protein [Streptomyces sp. NPDC059851]|uniref:4'-phosphopantetheinyl transferase family protein n=1 Tax=Streptomyces sp. NPDC059851 TaxID=3346971 RepID=UPI0036654128